MSKLDDYFDLNKIHAVHNISAAVINLSGRQRMLCQRIALFSLRLVTTKTQTKQEQIRTTLQQNLQEFEDAHQLLILGNLKNHINTQLSEPIQQIYYRPPYYLDQQVEDYLAAVKSLLDTPEHRLDIENVDLNWILNAASGPLLEALDAVVSQYQFESEIEQLELEKQQIQLYKKSCESTAIAHAQAQQLSHTLQELKETQAQLFHQEKMASLGQLIATLAHEINNPVHCIYGNINYLGDYIQDLIHVLQLYQQQNSQLSLELQTYIQKANLGFIIQDLPEIFQAVKLSSERIFEISRSLRNFSRKDELTVQPTNLQEGLESTLLILKSRLKPRSDRPEIQIYKDYSNLPLVKCYGGKINQVFMNLLSNAIDALEEAKHKWKNCQETPYIRIQTESIQSHLVRIRISDNGLGMETEVKQRLFEQFFTTKIVGKGTGLGLYISRGIIEDQHGGIISCQSKRGEGTEFTITLPIEFMAAIPLNYSLEERI